ncbi:MAG TPA: tRNA preQ1(34) S-adenosylmethionine ribosyltransferase-isomerase QueA [Vicinamibacterales bacterium]|nr:tRNA preQ1(34) S-adenosylmethionine ribosyltransferase-isomerase QueA [Vicinamibacterales bacterium]
MDVSDFDFPLPDELIAQTAAPRGESRLLVLDRATGAIVHTRVAALAEHLTAGDLLVANDTRVFPARLLGHRVPSGGRVECLLLARVRHPSSSLNARGAPPLRTEAAGAPQSSSIPPPASSVQVWDALVHPGQKLKEGARLRFEGDAGVLMAEIVARRFHGRRTLRLWAESGGDVDALVDALGHVPLPPYIHRPDTGADRERYQTVFASVRGSVAAPTAGLHFDDRLLARLDRAGIDRTTITLHVGYGTFKPVRTTVVEEHVVDPEPYEIREQAASAIAGARRAKRRVVAVGTTTTRALEDAAHRADGAVSAGAGLADLFIYPGFEFRVVSALMTNFHLPRSSLLMLVSAFAGAVTSPQGAASTGRELVEGRERVLAVYREAIAQRYRFYSYGDAMLIV